MSRTQRLRLPKNLVFASLIGQFLLAPLVQICRRHIPFNFKPLCVLISWFYFYVNCLGDISETFWNPHPLAFSQKYRRYKWEAYCSTNRRRIAVQLGGVLRCFPFFRTIFSTPNPQVCCFYFWNLVQKEKSLLRKPGFPY